MTDTQESPVQEATTVTLPFADVHEAFRLLTICTAAGRDARPTLSGVLVEWFDKGMRMVATDSYILAVVELGEIPVREDNGSKAQPVRSTIVAEPAKLVRMLKDNASSYRSLKAQDLVLSCDGQMFTAAGLFGSFSTPVLAADYPNWQQIIPAPLPEGTVTTPVLALSGYVLDKLAKLAKGATLRMSFNVDALKPTSFALRTEVGKGFEVRGVFMPVRVS